MRGFCAASLAAVLWCSAPVAAHHSFGAEYDVNAPITITGTLTGVSNLVGYCQSTDGHLLAFAIFTDGISVSAAHRFQDHIAITLAGSQLG